VSPFTIKIGEEAYLGGPFMGDSPFILQVSVGMQHQELRQPEINIGYLYLNTSNWNGILL
jgi:hypothetical protein